MSFIYLALLLKFCLRFTNQMEKMQTLVDLIDKEFRKRFEINDTTFHLDSEIKLEYLMELKEFFKLHAVCLLEICTKLTNIGFGSLGLILIQIFHNFKANMAYFLRFNIFFFKMKNFVHQDEEKKKEKANNLHEFIEEKEFTQEQLGLLRKFLSRKALISSCLMSSTNNKYEKLEKAKFFLEQEEEDLQQMLLIYNDTQNEVDEFLNRRTSTKSIQPSGVIKYLQDMIKEAKIRSFNLSTLINNENELLNKREIHIKDETFVEDVKNEIINAIDSGQKKVLKQAFRNKKRTSIISFNNHVEKECQTEEENLNNEKSYAVKKIVNKTVLDKRNIEDKNLFLEAQINNLNTKIFNLEKKLKQNEEEKDNFRLEKGSLNLKIERKKKKIAVFKLENLEILQKLENFVDKDTENRKLIIKKNFEYDKLNFEYESKDRENSKKMQNLELESEELRLLIQNLESEISRLNELVTEKERTDLILTKNLSIKTFNSIKKIELSKAKKSLFRSSTFNKENPNIPLKNFESTPKTAFAKISDFTHENIKINTNTNEKLLIDLNEKNYEEDNKSDMQDSQIEKKLDIINNLNLISEKKNKENNKNKSIEFIGLEKKESENEKNEKDVKFEEKKKENKSSIKKNSLLHANLKGLSQKAKRSVTERKTTEKQEKNLDKIEKIIEKDENIFKKEKTNQNYIETSPLLTTLKSLKLKEDDNNRLILILKEMKLKSNKSKIIGNFQKIFEIEDLNLEEIINNNESRKNTNESLKKINNSIKSNNENIIEQNQNNINVTSDLNNKDYQEFIQWKEGKNSELEKKIEERINLEKKIIENLKKEELKIKNKEKEIEIIEKNTNKEYSPKRKSKSIQFNEEFKHFQPQEIKTSTHAQLNFSKENMIFYKKLRTENNSNNYKANKELKNLFFSKENENFSNNNKRNSISSNFNKRTFDFEKYNNPFDKKDKEINDNYAKLKYFYKYPFQSISKNYDSLQKNEDNENLNNSFEKLFKDLLKKHEKCDFPCEHLKRFYKRIKFVSRFLHKEEYFMSKNVIDKLPLLIDKE